MSSSPSLTKRPMLEPMPKEALITEKEDGDENDNPEIVHEKESLQTDDNSGEFHLKSNSEKRPYLLLPGKDVPKFFSKRWIFCYFSFVGMLFVFVVRVGMSVAIVCMVKRKKELSNKTLPTDTSCSSNFQNMNENDQGEFEWDDLLVSNILAGFYYGYTFTNLLGGFLSDKFGGRKVFGYSLLSSSLLLFLYPVLSRVSGYWTLALRVISGLLSGPFFPAMHSLWGRWAPPVERGKLIALSYTGPFVGNILTLTLSGYLCANGFDNGWGSVFYLSGISSLLYSLLWFYFVYDSPQMHPKIGKAELDFLERAIQCQAKVKYIPWKCILTSKAVWAIIISHFCFNWSIFTFQTVLPMFMKDVLYFDIKTNGLMSSVPYFGMFIMYYIAGILADFVIRRGFLSVRGTRVFMQCTSFIGTATFFVATGFIKCSNAMIAIWFLFLVGSFMGFSAVGFVVNHVDIAPSYAGVLFGLTNTISALPGFIAPTLAGLLTPNGTQEEWQKVFFVCAGLATLGALGFSIFAKGEIQEWARNPCIKNTDTDDERNYAEKA